MLEANRIHIVLTVLITVIALLGCGEKRTVVPPNLLEIPPSYPQVLVVENNSSVSISVLPSSGSQAQPVVIAPGESVEIEFIVERLAERDRSGSVVETTWTAEVDQPNPYVEMLDADCVIDVETSAGEVWSYRIALGTCWFQNNPPTEEHELIVGEEEPAAGIPVLRLCE